MNKTQQMKLLAAILASQPEPSDSAVLTDERIREALLKGPRLTTAEKKLLWASRDAREHFLAIRKQVRLDLSEIVASKGLGTSELRLAASGSGSENEIRGNGFIVTVYRDHDFANQWSVSVQLLPVYLSLLPRQTPISLQDTGGVVWARGVPDVHNMIGAIWTAEEAPLDRLKIHKLRLDP